MPKLTSAAFIAVFLAIFTLPQNASAQNVCGKGICVNNNDIKSVVAVLDKHDKEIKIFYFSKFLLKEELQNFALSSGKDVKNVLVKIEIEYTDKDFAEIEYVEMNINSNETWEKQLGYEAGIYLKKRFLAADPEVKFIISDPKNANMLSLQTKGTKKAKTRKKGPEIPLTWDLNYQTIPLFEEIGQ